ncbi:LuxR C-terminal-related transcriptional regulator [Pseudomonas sp. NPDC089996]|uniref:LuxR C-terminal-related transcriptional regulator n=1 Tax=Pseudomonas sp. NPDC089996 TaxID=3364474 RepID=UPI003824A3C0
MATVLIIDRYPLHCLGVTCCLEQAGHRVLASTGNGLDGLDQATHTRPELIVLDLDVPRLGGLDLIKRLRARNPAALLLVLTALPAQVYELLCIEAGACGFVSKSDELEVFRNAVRSVLAGSTWFRAKVLHEDASPGVPADHLTARETTVLHYLAEGYRVKQIAGEMALSDRTVSTYKSRLLEKTGTHSLVELLQVASRKGLLETKTDAAGNTQQNADALHFSDLLDKVPYPVCLRAADARILAANQAFLDYLRLPREAVLQSRLRDVGVIDSEHLDYARKTFDSAVQQRIPYMMVVVVQVHGERRVMKNSGYPVIDDDGELLGMLCTSADISEEQERIDALQEQLAHLRFSRDLHGRYVLEHGQAMTAAIDRSRALLASPGAETGAAVAAQLGLMAEQVRRLDEMICLELGELHLQPYAEDLNALTEVALRNAQGRPLATSRFVPSPLTAHGWIDAARYASLLQALLSHLGHLQADEVTIKAHALEQVAGQLTWTLNFDADTALDTLSGVPVIHMAMARRLCTLLGGQLKVEPRQPRHFSANISLLLPLAVALPPG